MEVSIVSVENIRPSLPVHHLAPHRLSLLDQLAPATYSPLVLFYPPMKDAGAGHAVSRLKSSLSQTLNTYYPLSGRLQEEDRLHVHGYHHGVPFTETRVAGCLSEYLEGCPHLPWLHNLLPLQPLCLFPDPPSELPQVTAQVNVFDCGAVALGLCFMHKIHDGATSGAFIQSWAAQSSGSPDKFISPDLSAAAAMFPALPALTANGVSKPDPFYQRREVGMRRVVFQAEAIKELKYRAKSRVVRHPSEAQAVSAFIWKSAARWADRSWSRSFLGQAMDIRRLAKPRLTRNAFGNLTWVACTEPVEAAEMDISELVILMAEGVERVERHLLDALSGDRLASKILKQHLRPPPQGGGGASVPQAVSFTSWRTLGLGKTDFGWGKPVWFAVMGEASRTHPSAYNYTILKDAPGDQAPMEAWIIQDQQLISALDKDSHFLAFASPNPPIVLHH